MTAARQRKTRATYPPPTKLKKLVASLKEAAEAAGLKVDGIECAPDGTIRTLSESRHVVSGGGSAYDDWKSEGA